MNNLFDLISIFHMPFTRNICHLNIYDHQLKKYSSTDVQSNEQLLRFYMNAHQTMLDKTLVVSYVYLHEKQQKYQYRIHNELFLLGIVFRTIFQGGLSSAGLRKVSGFCFLFSSFVT